MVPLFPGSSNVASFVLLQVGIQTDMFQNPAASHRRASMNYDGPIPPDEYD